MGIIEGNPETFNAAGLIAKTRADCAGTLTMTIAPKVWRAEDGDLASIPSDHVGACEGYLRDADDTSSFDLECDDWSATLTAASTDSSDEIDNEQTNKNEVSKETSTGITKKMPRSSVQDAAEVGTNLIKKGMAGGRRRSNDRDGDDARVTLQKFSSVRGYEVAVNLNNGLTSAEVLAASHGQGAMTRQASDGTKVSNSLDKMYDWEVNWRKLKLLEEQGGGQKKDKDHMLNEGLLKRLQTKLGSLTPALSPSISVEPDEVEIEELVRDSPRFQNQLTEWDREAAVILEAAKKMIKSAESFLRANEEAVSVGQALATDIEKFGTILAPGSVSLSSSGGGGGTRRGSSVGEAEAIAASENLDGYHCVLSEWRFMSQELLILRTVLDEQLQATFVQALKQYFHSDVRGMRKKKLDYETARNKYATTVQKYLSQAASLSDSEKAKLQIDLMTLKEKVATSNEADVNKLRELVKNHRNDAKEHRANIRVMYLEARQRSMQTVAPEDMLTTLAQEGSNVKKEGWLIKLSNSQTPGLQRWKRKWFVLENGRLCYRKDSRTTDTKGNIDMMLTTVKLSDMPSSTTPLNKQRAFTFAVICASPQLHWQVQAESEQDRREWVHAMQTVTANLLGISVPGAPASHRKSSIDVGRESVHEMGSGMNLIEEVPTLKQCVECGSPAEWASINLGVTLCLECSGAHRSLGVHISKVRSLAMDSWPVPLLEFMKASGNKMNQQVWEGTYTPGHSTGMTMLRPQGPGEVERKKQWCVQKYVKKGYLAYLDSDDDLGHDLHRACKLQNLEGIMLLIAHGVDVNYSCDEDYQRTPLHTATIQAMHIAMMFDDDDDDDDNIKNTQKYQDWKDQKKNSMNILECLAVNSANLDVQDSHGRTAMHYAADDARGNHVMTWLIVRKARTDLCDTLGRTAADVAMIRGNESGAMAALEGIHDSPGRSVNGSVGGVNGVSEIRRSNYSRMISQRDTIESVDVGDIITYDDDGLENPSPSSSSSLVTKTEPNSGDVITPIQSRPSIVKVEASVNIPAAPSHAPPPPPPSIPEPWQEFLDVSTGDRYYFNPVSGKTTWDFPTS